MKKFFIQAAVVGFLTWAIPHSAFCQEAFYPSEQRVFSSGAFSDLNAAYIGRWDQMHIGLERAKDWAGFEGNPESGLFYIDNYFDGTNSSVGLGFKFDRIAAFSRNQINLSYAYSVKILDNGYKPLRLILGVQPSIDFFRAKYADVFTDLYPNAAPPEGLDQATFGLNAGFIITNGAYTDYEQNVWYAGLSTRHTGIPLQQKNDIANLKYADYIFLSGLRQNLNNQDLYLDATGYATINLAGIDLAGLINFEKYNPNHENAMGGWIGVGLKSNTQVFQGAKQMVFQLGLISRLFQGQDKL
ncbi:MAG: type IX secretion system membrane protein PorP/SprF, partial [Saprospiraceae bacterium]|nr:type IX secretion system membrane protein PorP/SprF [Saprospiraceae bacterium]